MTFIIKAYANYRDIIRRVGVCAQSYAICACTEFTNQGIVGEKVDDKCHIAAVTCVRGEKKQL